MLEFFFIFFWVFCFFSRGGKYTYIYYLYKDTKIIGRMSQFKKKKKFSATDKVPFFDFTCTTQVRPDIFRRIPRFWISLLQLFHYIKTSKNSLNFFSNSLSFMLHLKCYFLDDNV